MTLTEYIAKTTALLAAQPKGMGLKTEGGVVILLEGSLCFFHDGDPIDCGVDPDESAWEPHIEAIETAALARAELVQRFTPEEVAAYEAAA